MPLHRVAVCRRASAADCWPRTAPPTASSSAERYSDRPGIPSAKSHPRRSNVPSVKAPYAAAASGSAVQSRLAPAGTAAQSRLAPAGTAVQSRLAAAGTAARPSDSIVLTCQFLRRRWSGVESRAANLHKRNPLKGGRPGWNPLALSQYNSPLAYVDKLIRPTRCINTAPAFVGWVESLLPLVPLHDRLS